MQVVPHIKNIKTLPGFLPISQKLKILQNDFGESTRLSTRIKELTSKWSPLEKETNLKIIKNLNLKSEEAYQILINEQGIEINSRSDAGAFYAFISIDLLIRDSQIPYLEITDYPDLKVRGFMLDISRSKVPKVDTIKDIIRLLSRLKYNHLELYVEGFSLESKTYPEVLKDGNYLTIEEYQELEEYAFEFFIDLVPNENGFGHMQDWLLLDKFKELSEVDGLFEMWGSKRTPSTMDASNPQSVEFVKSLYDDFLPYTKSKYFNMNFDEPFELGHGKSKELVLQKGLGEVFVDYFLKLYDHVKKYDKTPMIWGDVLLKHPESIKRLPKDVVFIDWGYNVDYPYHKNLKLLSELGVTFMAAPATSTWGVITSRYLEMVTSIRNACLYTKMYGGEGMLLTDWGDIGHLQYWPYSYPGIIYGAMCSWDVENSREYEIKPYLESLVGKNLASVILDASTYTRLEGDYRSYGSKLFSSVLHSEGARNEEDKLTFFLNKMAYNLLTSDEAYALKLELEKLKDRINPTDELICQEVLGSIYLLNTLLEVNVALKAYFDKDIYLEKIDNCIFSLTNYLEIHQSLWEARNKKEGYKLSAMRLQQLIQILKKMKERGN